MQTSTREKRITRAAILLLPFAVIAVLVYSVLAMEPPGSIPPPPAPTKSGLITLQVAAPIGIQTSPSCCHPAYGPMPTATDPHPKFDFYYERTVYLHDMAEWVKDASTYGGHYETYDGRPVDWATLTDSDGDILERRYRVAELEEDGYLYDGDVPMPATAIGPDGYGWREYFFSHPPRGSRVIAKLDREFKPPVGYKSWAEYSEKTASPGPPPWRYRASWLEHQYGIVLPPPVAPPVFVMPQAQSVMLPGTPGPLRRKSNVIHTSPPPPPPAKE